MVLDWTWVDLLLAVGRCMGVYSFHDCLMKTQLNFGVTMCLDILPLFQWIVPASQIFVYHCVYWTHLNAFCFELANLAETDTEHHFHFGAVTALKVISTKNMEKHGWTCNFLWDREQTPFSEDALRILSLLFVQIFSRTQISELFFPL